MCAEIGKGERFSLCCAVLSNRNVIGIDINCLLVQWHSLSREEQAKYYEKARQERQLHMQLYPGWSARDNYGYGTKKKKRKKERTPVEAGGTKIARTLTHTFWEVWTWHRAVAKRWQVHAVVCLRFLLT